jgi:hypothetical protein
MFHISHEPTLKPKIAKELFFFLPNPQTQYIFEETKRSYK